MASFTHDILPQSPERGRLGRPSFSSQKTADRLRECERRPSIPSSTKIRPQRRSVFREEGLDDLNASVHHDPDVDIKAVHEEEIQDSKLQDLKDADVLKETGQNENMNKQAGQPWYSKLAKGSRPVIKTSATSPPGSYSSVTRVALIALLIAVVVPGFRYSGGSHQVNINGANAGVIREPELVDNASTIEGRQNSPTTVCTRWSHQSMFRTAEDLNTDWKADDIKLPI